MPKAKRSEDTLYYAKLGALIKAKMQVYGVTIESMAGSCGIAASTFYERLRKPNEFRLDELKAVAKRINTTTAAMMTLEGF